MDFTLTTYQKLLTTLKSKGYTFQLFADAIENPQANTIILRHDVDLHPENALRTAKIEHSLGIRSTYFFRIIPETFKPEIIQQIADLGHEIGYHYEDLTLAGGGVGSSSGSWQAAERSDKKIQTWVRRILPLGDRGKRGKTEVGGRTQAAGKSSNKKEDRSRKYEVSSKKIEKHGRASIKNNPDRDKARLVSSVISRLVTRLFRKKTTYHTNKTTLIDHAYQLFRHHLEQLRQYADIKTICMFNEVFILQV